jgi:uncharacterized protein (TIGR02588 family)
MEEGNPKEEHHEEIKDQKNLLEWAVFWVSLLLIIAIISYLGYQTFQHKPASPEIHVEFWPDPAELQPNRYRVKVHNKGGETAENVRVELVLNNGASEPEKVELEMPFVPQESSREGWVNFSQKPSGRDAVSANVVSYQKP